MAATSMTLHVMPPPPFLVPQPFGSGFLPPWDTTIGVTAGLAVELSL